ncbi:hypothetical protein T08_14803 [Trichinella sp. T8]|nr:hypothetical protein T08_14803 [Trichinella sp. T8]
MPTTTATWSESAHSSVAKPKLRHSQSLKKITFHGRTAVSSAQPEFHELGVRDHVKDSIDTHDRHWVSLSDKTQSGGEVLSDEQSL